MTSLKCVATQAQLCCAISWTPLQALAVKGPCSGSKVYGQQWAYLNDWIFIAATQMRKISDFKLWNLNMALWLQGPGYWKQLAIQVKVKVKVVDWSFTHQVTGCYHSPLIIEWISTLIQRVRKASTTYTSMTIDDFHLQHSHLIWFGPICGLGLVRLG